MPQSYVRLIHKGGRIRGASIINSGRPQKNIRELLDQEDKMMLQLMLLKRMSFGMMLFYSYNSNLLPLEDHFSESKYGSNQLYDQWENSYQSSIPVTCNMHNSHITIPAPC